MKRREIRSWLMDMDGVLVHEEQRHSRRRPVPRHACASAGLPFLVLTNNSMYTRRDLTARLLASGLDVPEEAIWTSALATAKFLEDQRPGGTAFVIGEAGLTTALHDAGYTLTERDPDYVVLGETRTYSFERIAQAIRLIVRGARFIATNPDPTGPTPDGPLPATGSVAALISRATGVDPYFVGKPNPLMMRSALNAIDAHSETAAMVGDRMDTDVVSGLEAGMHTVLVLTGITTREEAERFPYRPVADRRLDRRSDRRARLSHGEIGTSPGTAHVNPGLLGRRFRVRGRCRRWLGRSGSVDSLNQCGRQDRVVASPRLLAFAARTASLPAAAHRRFAGAPACSACRTRTARRT